MERFILWTSMVSVIAGQCSFPEELVGNWTSSNYGTLTFSKVSPHFIMSFGVVSGTASTSFDCYMIDDTRYILKSLDPITVFAGTDDVYAYLCLDLRKSGPYSYHYYQNSAEEIGFYGERLVGISEFTTDVRSYDVCTTTLDVGEFHTMVKIGYENEAAIQCADPLLLSATYTYTDATGTYCSDLNTTIIDSCNNNLTVIQFNDTLVNNNDCVAKVEKWSISGFLGCMVNIYDQNRTQYYVSLYNFDEDITSTYRYTCLAVAADENGTVYISLSPNDCIAEQDATKIPTNGAVMELKPFGVPVTTDPATDWTWLIILSICLFAMILDIVVGLIVCRYLAKRKKEEARKKMMLSDKHPMGEISLQLDAPASLYKIPDSENLELRGEVYNSPGRMGKEKPMSNPMPEPSLLLDFKRSKWSLVKDRISAIKEDPEDLFSEIAKDEVISVGPARRIAARNNRISRQRSFVSMPSKVRAPKSLSNGGLPNRNSISTGTFVVNRERPQYSQPEKPKTEKSSSLNAAESHTETNEAHAETETDAGWKDELKVSDHSKVANPPDPIKRSGSETVINKSSSIRSNKHIKTLTKHSLISWTGKRLVRSKSNAGVTRLTRGLTNTRLGSITTKKNSRNTGTVQRSQSLNEPQSENQPASPETLQKTEDKESPLQKEIVTTKVIEPSSDKNGDESADKSPADESPLPKLPKENENIRTESIAAPIVPESYRVPPTPLQDPSVWTDPMDNEVNTSKWLDTNEKQTAIDLNASFSGTYASFLNIKSKTDLKKKMLKPRASRMPWR